MPADKFPNGSSLKQTLDKFYGEFNFKERIKHDPVEFPHKYTGPEDIEAAGLIASCFAYGKVELFKPVIEKILKPGGKHPADFIRGFDLKRDRKYLKGISYRFNREEDVLSLVDRLGVALRKWGSLKDLFYHCYSTEDEDIGNALTGFVDYFLQNDKSGLSQFFPSPAGGSACKRMNLFLRWMVRTKDMDFGIWDRIPPSKLIIPLDVHIARIAGCLGLTKRKSSDWKTAKEITESLKRFDPDDPLKYDFALCHQGISRLCRGKGFQDTCATCAILPPPSQKN